MLDGTPLLLALGRALEHVTPLNLKDPQSGDSPKACRTFHDITRFAHEKAMAEMFDLADGRGDGGDEAIALRAGIPVAIHLLDMGGGLPDEKKATPEAVLSVPFGLPQGDEGHDLAGAPRGRRRGGCSA